LTFQRDDGGITIGLVTARGAAGASRIDPEGRGEPFRRSSGDLSGMHDLPEVTPDTVATSPVEVARGLPDVRSSEAPERRAVAAVRIAARITHGTEMSRTEITHG
jgi:hypothetical protein